MTKQLITQAIFQSVNIRYKDADLLASLVLVTIRDEIIKSGELRLPGLGTFKVGPKPKKIGKKELSKHIHSVANVTQRGANKIATSLIDMLRSEVQAGNNVLFCGVGELGLSEGTVGAKRIVRFRPSPPLLDGGISAAAKLAD